MWMSTNTENPTRAPHAARAKYQISHSPHEAQGRLSHRQSLYGFRRRNRFRCPPAVFPASRSNEAPSAAGPAAHRAGCSRNAPPVIDAISNTKMPTLRGCGNTKNPTHPMSQDQPGDSLNRVSPRRRRSRSGTMRPGIDPPRHKRSGFVTVWRPDHENGDPNDFRRRNWFSADRLPPAPNRPGNTKSPTPEPV